MRLSAYLMVVAVLLLILSLANGFYEFIILRYDISSELMMSYLVFYAILTLLLLSYLRTFLSDPGSIPAHFSSVPEESKITLDEESYDVHSAAKVTYCSKCQHYRPARAHHCSVCNRCILRMDHHCPWVGNCVGLKNHRLFIQFLVYACLDSSVVGISCMKLVLEGEFSNYLYYCAAVGLLVGTSLAGLAMMHIWLIISNRSSLELRSIFSYNLFDLMDWKDNLREVFGTNVLAYFLPIGSDTKTDGVYYDVYIKNTKGETEAFQNKILV